MFTLNRVIFIRVDLSTDIKYVHIYLIWNIQIYFTDDFVKKNYFIKKKHK